MAFSARRSLIVTDEMQRSTLSNAGISPDRIQRQVRMMEESNTALTSRLSLVEGSLRTQSSLLDDVLSQLRNARGENRSLQSIAQRSRDDIGNLRRQAEAERMQMAAEYNNQMQRLNEQKQRELADLTTSMTKKYTDDMQAQLISQRAAIETVQRQADMTKSREVFEQATKAQKEKEDLRQELSKKNSLELQRQKQDFDGKLTTVKAELGRSRDAARQKEQEHTMQLKSLQGEVTKKDQMIVQLKGENVSLRTAIKEWEKKMEEKSQELVAVKADTKRNIRYFLDEQLSQKMEQRLETVLTEHQQHEQELVQRFNAEKQTMLSAIADLKVKLSEADWKLRNPESLPQDLLTIEELITSIEEEKERYENRGSLPQDLQTIEELKTKLQEVEHQSTVRYEQLQALTYQLFEDETTQKSRQGGEQNQYPQQPNMSHVSHGHDENFSGSPQRDFQYMQHNLDGMGGFGFQANDSSKMDNSYTQDEHLIQNMQYQHQMSEMQGMVTMLSIAQQQQGQIPVPISMASEKNMCDHNEYYVPRSMDTKLAMGSSMPTDHQLANTATPHDHSNDREVSTTMCPEHNTPVISTPEQHESTSMAHARQFSEQHIPQEVLAKEHMPPTMESNQNTSSTVTAEHNIHETDAVEQRMSPLENIETSTTITRKGTEQHHQADESEQHLEAPPASTTEGTTPIQPEHPVSSVSSTTCSSSNVSVTKPPSTQELASVKNIPPTVSKGPRLENNRIVFSVSELDKSAMETLRERILDSRDQSEPEYDAHKDNVDLETNRENFRDKHIQVSREETEDEEGSVIQDDQEPHVLGELAIVLEERIRELEDMNEDQNANAKQQIETLVQEKETMQHELSQLKSHKSNFEKKYDNKLAELRSGHRKKENEQASAIETLERQCLHHEEQQRAQKEQMEEVGAQLRKFQQDREGEMSELTLRVANYKRERDEFHARVEKLVSEKGVTEKQFKREIESLSFQVKTLKSSTEKEKRNVEQTVRDEFHARIEKLESEKGDTEKQLKEEIENLSSQMRSLNSATEKEKRNVEQTVTEQFQCRMKELELEKKQSQQELMNRINELASRQEAQQTEQTLTETLKVKLEVLESEKKDTVTQMQKTIDNLSTQVQILNAEKERTDTEMERTKQKLDDVKTKGELLQKELDETKDRQNQHQEENDDANIEEVEAARTLSGKLYKEIDSKSGGLNGQQEDKYLNNRSKYGNTASMTEKLPEKEPLANSEQTRNKTLDDTAGNAKNIDSVSNPIDNQSSLDNGELQHDTEQDEEKEEETVSIDIGGTYQTDMKGTPTTQYSENSDNTSSSEKTYSHDNSNHETIHKAPLDSDDDMVHGKENSSEKVDSKADECDDDIGLTLKDSTISDSDRKGTIHLTGRNDTREIAPDKKDGTGKTPTADSNETENTSPEGSLGKGKTGPAASDGTGKEPSFYSDGTEINPPTDSDKMGITPLINSNGVVNKLSAASVETREIQLVGRIEKNNSVNSVATRNTDLPVSDVTGKISPSDSAATENSPRIDRDGTGKTNPIDSDGTGKTVPTDIDGTGKTDPIDNDGTGKTDPTNSDGTGKTDPTNSDGTGKTDPTNSDGTGKTDPIDNDGTGKTDPIDNDGTGKTDPTNSDGTGKTVSTDSDLKGKTPPAEPDGKGKVPPTDKEGTGKTPTPESGRMEKIPPNDSVGTGKTDTIHSDGTGKTDPIKGYGTGKTDLIDSDGTGKTDPTGIDGTGKTNPTDSDGTGKTVPTDSNGTGKTDPTDSDGTGKTVSTDSDGTGKTDSTDSYLKGKTPPVEPDGKGKTPPSHSEGTGKTASPESDWMEKIPPTDGEGTGKTPTPESDGMETIPPIDSEGTRNTVQPDSDRKGKTPPIDSGETGKTPSTVIEGTEKKPPPGRNGTGKKPPPDSDRTPKTPSAGRDGTRKAPLTCSDGTRTKTFPTSNDGKGKTPGNGSNGTKKIPPTGSDGTEKANSTGSNGTGKNPPPECKVSKNNPQKKPRKKRK